MSWIEIVDSEAMQPGAVLTALRSAGLPTQRVQRAASESSGTPVVLIHGLPSFASDWASTPELLARRGLRVISYDRSGYGYSTRDNPDNEKNYTQQSNARDLALLLDALQIQRAAIVGWSYGGAVAQTFAEANPERVSHLALVASVGPASQASRGAVVEGMAGPLLETSLGEGILRWTSRVPAVARMTARAPLLRAFSGDAAIPEGWSDYTTTMIARPGTFAAWKSEHARYDPSLLHPEKIGAPTLVLHGTDDRSVDFSIGEDLAKRLPGASLIPIFEASHMLPVTHAARLSEEIARFIAP